MIPTIHILSNPIGSLAKLLYTNSNFFNLNSLKPSGVRKADLEFLLEYGLGRQKDTRFTKIFEKYKLYMD